MVPALEKVNTQFDVTVNSLHHLIFAANLEQNETDTFKDMINQVDRGDFVLEFIKEEEDHESREHLMLIPKSQMPSDAKTITLHHIE